jgi:transcriptional regulator with XRE-family HTH domain
MDLNEIENHIGKQIKMLRLSRKISQKELAKQMGITYQQVQKYENGLNKISVSRLWQVCNIFEISPNYLFENILSEAPRATKSAPLIPNSLATSQDMKLMLAFKKIDDSSKRALMIKVCQAMATEEEAPEKFETPVLIQNLG